MKKGEHMTDKTKDIDDMIFGDNSDYSVSER
jgi:hypothetical protein